MFEITELPVLIDHGKAWTRCGASLIMAILASLPVAIWASCKPPLEALREE
jgi:ABC-type lipoprotein release transport system permease subunit